MAPRSPTLHQALRGFCLGAFSVFDRELEAGAQLPFAFEEHASLGRPALYEYRPLVREFVEARADRLMRREDARIALDELRREPAAAIFARAHSGSTQDPDAALVGSVLAPLLIRTADACGGFDWDDQAFEGAYAELERSLFGDGHAYAAVAPLVGLSLAVPAELGPGLRVRHAATGELAAHWPEAAGLLPADFGNEPDRLALLELERSLARGDVDVPDAPAELGDAVTAVRLAAAGAVACGPVLFERLDWRPYAIRPAFPVAALQPPGEPVRLDAFRARLVADVLERLPLADDDPELAEALDRWELSLFQDEPLRTEQLRETLTALLGGEDGPWASALRAAVLLGSTGAARSQALATLRPLSTGEPASDACATAVRRALVEVLLHGDRRALVAWLDDALLGVRPGPIGFYARLAVAGPSGALAAA